VASARRFYDENAPKYVSTACPSDTVRCVIISPPSTSKIVAARKSRNHDRRTEREVQGRERSTINGASCGKKTCTHRNSEKSAPVVRGWNEKWDGGSVDWSRFQRRIIMTTSVLIACKPNCTASLLRRFALRISSPHETICTAAAGGVAWRRCIAFCGLWLVSGHGVVNHGEQMCTTNWNILVTRGDQKALQLGYKKVNILYSHMLSFLTYSFATLMHIFNFFLSCLWPGNRIFCFDSQTMPSHRSLVIHRL